MTKENGLLQATYEQLGSLRFTVMLLLTLAAGSLLGTLLPQGMSEREILMRFGETRAYWIRLLRLDDLYHAGWFQALLVLLSANLVVCTLRRLPRTRKLLAREDREIRSDKLRKFALHRDIRSIRSAEETEAILAEEIQARFAPLAVRAGQPGYAAIAERGRWSHWMLYLVHGSVLVILFGALMGSLFGYKGFMNLHEGESSRQVQLLGSDRAVTLPFEVRCDRFEVAFYENGMPKDYRSDLVLLSQGQELTRRSLRVNDPLSHAGVTFYQASYGTDLEMVELELVHTETKAVHRVRLPMRRPIALPGAAGDVQVVEFRDDFQGFGPALAVGLYQDESEPTGSWILADHPTFHGNRVGPYQVKVVQLDKRRFTGLQVKKDPGFWLVLGGFTTLLIGMGLAFYTSHRKLWVVVEQGNPESRIVLAGRSNKNSLAFENEFHHLGDRLQERLQAR